MFPCERWCHRLLRLWLDLTVKESSHRRIIKNEDIERGKWEHFPKVESHRMLLWVTHLFPSLEENPSLAPLRPRRGFIYALTDSRPHVEVFMTCLKQRLKHLVWLMQSMKASGGPTGGLWDLQEVRGQRPCGGWELTDTRANDAFPRHQQLNGGFECPIPLIIHRVIGAFSLPVWTLLVSFHQFLKQRQCRLLGGDRSSPPAAGSWLVFML